MPPDITGVQIGRQFWVSNNIQTLGQAIGTQQAQATQSTQNAPSLAPPDKSFVNYVRGGKGAQFASAVREAKTEAFHQRSIGGNSAGNAVQTAQRNLRELFGSDDLEGYAKNLAQRVVNNPGTYFNGMNAADATALLKKALVSLLNMSEVNELAGHHQNDAQWTNALDSRSLAIDNAVLGIAELMHTGAVDEDSVLCMTDGKVLSVNNYDDLKKIMTESTKAAQKTFVDKDRLLQLKNDAAELTRQNIESLKTRLPKGKGLNVRTDANHGIEGQIKAAEDMLASINATVDRLIEERENMSKSLTETADAVTRNTSASTDREKKADLQKISNATRTFRYTMDRHVKRQEGVGAKIRRFFSHLFFRDDRSKVTDAAFKEIRKTEAALQEQLNQLNFSLDRASGCEPLSFADVKTTSKEAGDLTHMANSLLRNCSKKVDKSYVAYMDRAHALFDNALNNSRSEVQTFKMTCKIGVEFAFDFGIGKGKAGADVQREVEVMVHPGGKISMRLATGAGVHGGVSFTAASVEAEADYMQGRVLTFDSFDKFVAAAYGKLALPVTDGEKDSRLVGLKKGSDVKFIGDTSGNVAKRAFRNIGFLEFGTHVDTELFRKTLNAKGFLLGTTALVDGLDTDQGHVASAKEKKVHGSISAGIKYASEDESKKIGFGVGVDGVLWKRTDDVESVDIFDLMAGVPQAELEGDLAEQMKRVQTNVLKKTDGDSFVVRTGLNKRFDARLAEIVAKAKDQVSTAGEASKQIRNLIGDLQWKASAHAPKRGSKAAEGYWMDYASCLRACTLAQSVIESLVSADPASAAAKEIHAYTEEIRSAAKDLRSEMPSSIYDNHVMFAVRTREEPWHSAVSVALSFDLDIDGEKTKQSSQSGQANSANQTVQSGSHEKKIDFDGTLTWFELKNGEPADKYRPWATASGRYVDINLQDGEMKDKLLDEIAGKAVPEDAADPDAEKTRIKSELTTLLTNAGVKVEGAQNNGTTSPKGTVSVRLEYDGNKKLTRFSASSQTVTTQSQSKGKGPLKINFSRVGTNTNELTSVFFRPSLARVMGDVEELVKGSLNGDISYALNTYAVTNHEVVERFCDDLANPGSEAGKMMKQLDTLLPALKNHPAYKSLASSYETRLTALKADLQAPGTHTSDWKVEKGTDYLQLATQTMRLASMFENNAMKTKGIFIV